MRNLLSRIKLSYKLKLISASINSLDLKTSELASHLHQFIKAHDLGSFWISEKVFPQLWTFSNEPIHVEGKIQSPITSNGWIFDSATFTVVADGLKSLIGRELFDKLG